MNGDWNKHCFLFSFADFEKLNDQQSITGDRLELCDDVHGAIQKPYEAMQHPGIV